jgi:glycosyltransferase involved in cell wall biosynthesis
MRGKAMAPRKVLFVDFYAFIGGGQQNLLSVFKAIDRRRWEPLLAIPKEGPFAEAARALKVKVFITPMGKARWRKPWEALPSMERLLAVIRGEDVALVHANCFPANKLAGPAARLAGVPCLWHKQIAVTQRPGSTTGFLWRFYSRYNQRVLGVSRQVVDGMRALGIPARKLTLLYNNADTDALAKARPLNAAACRKAGVPAPRSAPLVLAAGMRRPHKGFEVYLRACATVAGVERRSHFALLGDTAHAEEAHEALLAELSAAPALKGRLHSLPSQSPLAPWLKRADVFVSSSWWEGSPLVVLEAMACGRPVVATRQAAGELIRDGKDGLLVDAGDASALADAILHLVKDRAFAARLGKAARETALRRFSLKVYVQELMKIYDELCSQGVR